MNISMTIKKTVTEEGVTVEKKANVSLNGDAVVVNAVLSELNANAELKVE